jgi:hypothetical protein
MSRAELQKHEFSFTTHIDSRRSISGRFGNMMPLSKKVFRVSELFPVPE